MARRTGAWRLTPLTARSTRGVLASFVTSRPSSSTVSRRPSWSGRGRSTVIVTSFANRPSASPSSGETPRSSAANVNARYMSPVSMKVASVRSASAYPIVLLPEPDGPSMATDSSPSPAAWRGPRSRGGPGA